MSWNQYHNVETVESLIGRLYLAGEKEITIVERKVVPTFVLDDLFDWNYPASLEHVTLEFSANNKGIPKKITYIPQIYKEETTDDTGNTYWQYFPEGTIVKVESVSLLYDDND